MCKLLTLVLTLSFCMMGYSAEKDFLKTHNKKMASLKVKYAKSQVKIVEKQILILKKVLKSYMAKNNLKGANSVQVAIDSLYNDKKSYLGFIIVKPKSAERTYEGKLKTRQSNNPFIGSWNYKANGLIYTRTFDDKFKFKILKAGKVIHSSTYTIEKQGSLQYAVCLKGKVKYHRVKDELISGDSRMTLASK